MTVQHGAWPLYAHSVCTGLTVCMVLAIVAVGGCCMRVVFRRGFHADVLARMVLFPANPNPDPNPCVSAGQAARIVVLSRVAHCQIKASKVTAMERQNSSWAPIACTMTVRFCTGDARPHGLVVEVCRLAVLNRRRLVVN